MRMARDASSSALAGPTPFRYFTSEESVSLEVGIVFNPTHYSHKFWAATSPAARSGRTKRL